MATNKNTENLFIIGGLGIAVWYFFFKPQMAATAATSTGTPAPAVIPVSTVQALLPANVSTMPNAGVAVAKTSCMPCSVGNFRALSPGETGGGGMVSTLVHQVATQPIAEVVTAAANCCDNGVLGAMVMRRH